MIQLMLETWNFDDSDCETRFTLKTKLSEDQKWTPSFTEMTIKEYRRFLALAVDQCEVVPSRVIDEVWHQHLLNTENYADMCEQLKIPFLHHRPTSSEKDLEEKSTILAFQSLCFTTTLTLPNTRALRILRVLKQQSTWQKLNSRKMIKAKAH